MTKQNTDGNFAVYLTFGIFFVISVLSSLKGLKTFLDYRTLEKDGVHVTAKIVNRIYLPGGRSRSLYYINYKFENSMAKSDCALSESHFTTPKDKACRVTIQTHKILEHEYTSVKVGDDVGIIYLPSSSKTKSVVKGMAYDEKTSLFGAFFFLFLGLISLLVLLKFAIKGMLDRLKS